MEIITEQNIDQMLIDELSKLKKAVTYIEQAQDTVKNATNLLSEITDKYNAVDRSRVESENLLLAIKQHNEIAEKKVAEFLRLEEELPSKIRYATNMFETLKDEFHNIEKKVLTNLINRFSHLDSSVLSKIEALEVQSKKDVEEIKNLKEENQYLKLRGTISFIISLIAIIVAVTELLLGV